MIPPDRTDAYVERVRRLQNAIELAAAADQDPAFNWALPHWEILRLPRWHGYGQALKAGLELVRTELVLVMQHDYAFVQRVDLPALARAMSAPQVSGMPLNYIGLLKKAQLSYRDAVRCRSGLDLGELITAPSGSSSCTRKVEDKEVAQSPRSDQEVRLLRLPQLYDSIHLANTAWYLSLFSRRFSRKKVGIPIGQFPEDVLSEHMLDLAKSVGAAAVVEEFGTYLHACENAEIAHIDGRRFLDPKQRAAQGWPSHTSKYFPNDPDVGV